MRYRFLRFPGGKTKAVTFSYDDARREDIRLAEIINRYGMKCTFNINSGMLGTKDGEGKLTIGEISKYILEAGHEIAVHGKLHRALGKVRTIEGITDVLNCRKELEKTFGRIIRGMAYPDTGINVMNNTASYENIRQYLQYLDIAYARTIDRDNNSFDLPTDWYEWMPTAHHNNPNVLQWAKEFVELDVNGLYIANRCPKLYYLWGHSVEFENNQNWDLIESLCACLAGHDDIWYATNIEIYNYVTAYHSLAFSADGMIVYNPTLYDIWFDVDRKSYMIKSGETITIE